MRDPNCVGWFNHAQLLVRLFWRFNSAFCHIVTGIILMLIRFVGSGLYMDAIFQISSPPPSPHGYCKLLHTSEELLTTTLQAHHGSSVNSEDASHPENTKHVDNICTMLD